MVFGSQKLRGYISTREGVIISGYKTKFGVDPGLQDVIAPIAVAQINALSNSHPAGYVHVNHINQTLPDSLQTLIQGERQRRMLLDSA